MYNYLIMINWCQNQTYEYFVTDLFLFKFSEWHKIYSFNLADITWLKLHPTKTLVNQMVDCICLQNWHFQLEDEIKTLIKTTKNRIQLIRTEDTKMGNKWKRQQFFCSQKGWNYFCTIFFFFQILKYWQKTRIYIDKFSFSTNILGFVYRYVCLLQTE